MPTRRRRVKAMPFVDHPIGHAVKVPTGFKQGYADPPAPGHVRHGALGRASEGAVQHALKEGSKRVTQISETTRFGVRKRIKEAIEQGMSPAEAGAYVRGWSGFDEYRAERIARTEMMFSFNSAAVASYQENGVQEVVADDGDEDPECAERHGQVFSVEEAASIEDHPNGTLDWLPVAPDLQAKTVQSELNKVRGLAVPGNEYGSYIGKVSAGLKKEKDILAQAAAKVAPTPTPAPTPAALPQQPLTPQQQAGCQASWNDPKWCHVHKDWLGPDGTCPKAKSQANVITQMAHSGQNVPTPPLIQSPPVKQVPVKAVKQVAGKYHDYTEYPTGPTWSRTETDNFLRLGRGRASPYGEGEQMTLVNSTSRETRLAKDLGQEWRGSSTSYGAQALKSASAERRGFQLTAWEKQAEQRAIAYYGQGPWDAAKAAAQKALQYHEDWMKTKGYNPDTVITLYRGVGLSQDIGVSGSEGLLQEQGALASWSTDIDRARQFGMHKGGSTGSGRWGYVLETKVRVGDIAGMGETNGIGTYYENEVVPYGGGQRKVRVVERYQDGHKVKATLDASDTLFVIETIEHIDIDGDDSSDWLRWVAAQRKG